MEFIMLDDKRKVTINGQDVVLDTSKLYFSEGTLSDYLETEGGWIDYFGAKLADAERQLAEKEMEVEREDDEYERVYSKVFAQLKDQGGSDKYVEGLTKVEPVVVDARNKVLDLKSQSLELKHNTRLLYQHLRAWDKNHENAQNRGNTLRKEMERITKDRILEDRIHEIAREV
jgi:hypothetical protein